MIAYWMAFCANGGRKVKNLSKKIITFTLVLCMALSVFTGVVYAKDNDTIVILYENDVHCAVEGYYKFTAERKKQNNEYSPCYLFSRG